MDSMTKPALLYFDDQCLVCNGFVQFVLAQDKNRGNFRFASLHSPGGRQVLEGLEVELEDRETMILVEDGQTFVQSSALLKVLRRLGGGWRLWYPLMGVPERIRDFCYQLFSKNRYRFGKNETACMLIRPEQRKYFANPSPA